tara:strand:- start:698 stop:1447 length:750 start_codon:yes stop_codon:yes gene_type:complete
MNNKKHGIVTGAGKGIGLAIVKLLLINNYSITAITRSKSVKLENLKKVYKKNLEIIYYDLSSIEGLEKMFTLIFKNNKPSFLINNAGTRSRNRLDLTTNEELIRVNNLNYLSPFIITKKYLKNIKKKDRYSHSIISITSIVGPRGFSELSAYAASKGALEAGMKSLAIEYAEKNVRINCVAPGFIKSSYFSNFKKDKPELYKWTLDKTPMNRWGNSEEVANVVEFLVSEKSSYITGSVIYVDGGWTAGS